MARGDLELSFVTKITSPKNLLKALAVVIFGFVPLLGASGCARDSATRNSISCHTLQIRDPDATPPLTPLALAAQSEPALAPVRVASVHRECPYEGNVLSSELSGARLQHCLTLAALSLS